MKTFKELSTTVFRAVGLAMGVATTALLIMGKVEVSSALMMLSIGVATLGISTFTQKGDKVKG